MVTNIQNLQKSKIDVILDIAIYDANAEIFLLMKIDDLLANPEVKADFGNLLDNNQIKIFNTLEK